jgi:hypothetical protein
MKRYFQKKWVRVLAVVLATLTGAWAVGAVRDRYEVVKMTEKMKTVCVGRLLIDLPDEAQHHLYRAWVDGFDIEAFAESPEAFRKRVAAREAEIRAKPDRLGGDKNLETVREVTTDSGLAGKMFVHGRNVSEGTEGYSADTLRHYRYEGVALEAHVHGDGISIDVSADDYDPDLIENLPKLVSQLVANPHNHMPTEPGFCLDRAYVRDPLTAEQGERIAMLAGLPSRPDIELRFDTMAGTKPDDRGLLERNAASHARAPAAINMRFTNLRAAPRMIGGLTGDELVERVIEENFAIIYGFEWDVNGTEDNVFVPAVTLQMKTGSGDGGPVPSSLSQLAALALWDKISSSIRIRPTQVPKASAPEPAASPLGAHALAGNLCPQSGWWECADGGDGVEVYRGQRQYVRQGERMPQALLLPPQTVWEKVRGLRRNYVAGTPTSWKLVDKRSRRRVVTDVPLAQATPAAASPTGAGVSERVAIGVYAITGNPCPASGWWQCQESDALDGTRWFAQGSLLPAATFAVSNRALGNSSGTPTVIQRRGTWQLVRLAQEFGRDLAAPGSTSDGSIV